MTYWMNNVILPKWLSGRTKSERVSVAIEDGLVTAIVRTDDLLVNEHDPVWEGDGKLVISGLCEMHTHLDKTYTRHRLGDIKPGLLNAIQAMDTDKRNWNGVDLLPRMQQALERAYINGVTKMRTHIDWFDLTQPLAWQILDDLSTQWRNKIEIERVALIPLPTFENVDIAMTIAALIKQSQNSLLGAFIHSSNFSPSAMSNLLAIANEFELDLDLHINEELHSADGLVWLAEYLNNHSFNQKITCGHACGLHALNSDEVEYILSTFAKHKVTIVALPTTNLLLQDAVTDATPSHRGITLVKEALNSGVDVMFSSDNVADAFCPYGDYNPVSVLKLACITSQLDNPFEDWSQAISTIKPLSGSPHSVLIGQPADFVVFDHGNVHIWPEHQHVQIMRKGQWLKSD
ncbi:amidohydrolase family protein [Vibrio sp. B1FLJ16]|uniref:amidohydrolase family protein n=1 Tax=Vibrio sp. B1FLJ16 TaxID=2751178 RepID=UPI0015F40647|nr:amidohydrolase family protein [Vibrio sp. B1FLJ16]CAD7807230.1 Cytosine deaminase and related metal-dependent hydrolases [Vibrio sp. B1FLJ16]CAE6905149.1 Cytosine deaminase and related metal-dependent hydrolases [Vibrio sp. B1FLJ16]